MRKVVIIHLHYLETIGELLKYAHTINPDLLLVTYTKNDESIRQIQDEFQNVKYYHVENRGRDIYPLLFLSKLGYFEQDSVVWKLHSKKSLHLIRGHKWFKELCDAIAKDSSRVDAVGKLFSDTNIAMVGANKYLKKIARKTIDEHAHLYHDWSNQLKYSHTFTHAKYISGTIFVTRSFVLDQLKYLVLKKDDFYLEDLGVKFTKWFAVKLYVFNWLKKYGIFPGLSNKLDKSTRPASQVTYALEAYLGYVASHFGEIRGI